MPKCQKCYAMLAPPFVNEMADGGKQCVFCIEGTNTLKYKGGVVTKEDIVKEYEIFLKVIKERNEILKNAVKGDDAGIPERMI